MVDETALFSLTYGLYLIGSKDGDKNVGCVVNTLQQVTNDPLQVSVTLNKENATTAAIQKSGRFTAAVLAETAPMLQIGTFGFYSSKDRDKFENYKTLFDAAEHPYVAEQVVARLSARVVNQLDVGTHIIFVGEVEEAERLLSEKPMTYAYYHEVKGGKTPPKASSYIAQQ